MQTDHPGGSALYRGLEGARTCLPRPLTKIASPWVTENIIFKAHSLREQGYKSIVLYKLVFCKSIKGTRKENHKKQ